MSDMHLQTDVHPNVALAADELALWKRWREQSDMQAREALINRFIAYARVIGATFYARRTHDEVGFDDYHQWACLGLIESVERFDPASGAQFKTFAAHRMRGTILNGLERASEKSQQIAALARLRKERLQAVVEMNAARAATAGLDEDNALLHRLAQVGIGLALTVLLEDTCMVQPHESDAGAAPSPEVGYFRASTLQTLRAALSARVAELPVGQRRVIQYHYQQDIPFERIATMLGVTRGRVSQLHRAALTRLREVLGQGPPLDVAL